MNAIFPYRTVLISSLDPPPTQPAQFRSGAAASGWYEWPCGRLDWRLMSGPNAGEMTLGSMLTLGATVPSLKEKALFLNKLSEIRIGKGKKQKMLEVPSLRAIQSVTSMKAMTRKQSYQVKFSSIFSTGSSQKPRRYEHPRNKQYLSPEIV